MLNGNAAIGTYVMKYDSAIKIPSAAPPTVFRLQLMIKKLQKKCD